MTHRAGMAYANAVRRERREFRARATRQGGIMDEVFAVQVRRSDPPQFVAEDSLGLAERAGELLYLEQCDYCGNSCYRLERVGHGSPRPIYGYSARCITDPDKDDDDPAEGCGKGYPVRLYAAEGVCF
jgi:hypothetical protein